MKHTLNPADSAWLEQVYARLCAKMSAQVLRQGDRAPHVTRNGSFGEDMLEKDVYWWTNGFWPGMLWQMYHATGESVYREAAEKSEGRLAEALTGYTGLHHDVGFMFHLASVAGFKLTGDAEMLRHGRHAAGVLAGRYNPLGQFIRAWENYDKNEDKSGWIIIDCLMNLPLLYWAAEEENDVRFSAIAKLHALTAAKHLLRPDGSANHIAILDPHTGELLDTPGGQGYAPGSSWTRGQAWALYGFALSAKYTGEAELLGAAKRSAHYFIANAALNGWNVVVDFRSPAEPVKTDASAAACAACGLLCLAGQVDEMERPLYQNAALALLRRLDEGYANWTPEQDGLIGGAAGSYFDPDQPVSIIYGDFFFQEAVLRLMGKGFEIW